MRWAYGVTTVPERFDSLLPQTLKSLKAAGFDTPRLFVDGATNSDAKLWEEKFALPVTARHPRLLVHGNWVLSLYELFIREPRAERFAIFQDDFVTYRGLREYLEKCGYPDGPVLPDKSYARDNADWMMSLSRRCPGYLNLYSTPSCRQVLTDPIGPGVNYVGWYKSQQNGRGAVALVFSREAVVTLLSSRHLIERPLDSHRGWRSVDGGIVDAMRKVGWCEYVHSPSLVFHTGQYSTIQKRAAATAECALPTDQASAYVWPAHYNGVDFKGEEFDATDFLPTID